MKVKGHIPCSHVSASQQDGHTTKQFNDATVACGALTTTTHTIGMLKNPFVQQ